MNPSYIPYFNPTQMRNQNTSQTIPCPLMLARAYVLSQPYTGLFSLETALKVGTVFPNLFEAFPKII